MSQFKGKAAEGRSFYSFTVRGKKFRVNNLISRFRPEWGLPNMTDEMTKILGQCSTLEHFEITNNIKDITKRSEEFPIPFPINNVRLKELKKTRPENKLKHNIASTYPLMHERVLILMSSFIEYKRVYGSASEKTMYKDMTVPQLVDRILKKRAVAFLNAVDSYMLLTGERGSDGWDLVGTPEQRAPLVLENCLSYDEMKLSAMVYVSGYTECINNGARHNEGVVSGEEAEEDAVIIGIVGSRFEREGRMDCEEILITNKQNKEDNGYGVAGATPSAKQQWRRMWAQFYEVPSIIYDELKSHLDFDEQNAEKMSTERYVKVAPEVIFDNEVYYKRLSILAETTLLEADARAAAAGREVYLNVIGAGLGVWKVSPHQTDVFVATIVERARSLLLRGALHHVMDINFSYIRPSAHVLVMFQNRSQNEDQTQQTKRMFLTSKAHPKGGINVQLENREPASKLMGGDAGKLLVITYPWDGNAHPGNEFWLGSLSGSGDPAAACSTQVTELHNAHINPFVSGSNVRVAGRAGVTTLRDTCLALVTYT